MAIQNFLAGGFYGKLGDVVGQRWRNKRTIRAHVIPFNPRTEKQQSNRQQFALATRLAQQAFNINKGWDIWQRPDMGQFSFMVGTAKRRLQAGMSPAEALPLYPDDFDPSVVIRNASPDWSQWSLLLTIRDDTYIMSENRRLEYVLNCYDMKTDQWVLLKHIWQLDANQPFTIHFDTENRYALPAGSTIQAVTIDDAEHGNMSISLPVINLVQPSKLACQIEIEEWDIDTTDYPELLYFHTHIPFPQLFGDFNISVRLRNINTGNWVNDTVSFIIEEPNSVHGSVYIEYNDRQDPPGSRINRLTLTLPEQEFATFLLDIYEFDFSFM